MESGDSDAGAGGVPCPRRCGPSQTAACCDSTVGCATERTTGAGGIDEAGETGGNEDGDDGGKGGGDGDGGERRNEEAYPVPLCRSTAPMPETEDASV